MINSVEFEVPEIDDLANKPFAVSNKSFPYDLIASDRRFEELLYSIYKCRIESGVLSEFDDISLMNGVRDQGRDCALIRRGKCYGLIQCKKYGKNYGKNDFGKEITRFVLYSMLDERLIEDYADFSYYLAVSTGVTADCDGFITDFGNQILIEPKLGEWVLENLKMATLRNLEAGFDLETFRKLLSRIKVKKIIPQDLDIFLVSPTCSSIVPLFFEVRTVTDNSKVEEVIKILRPEYTKEDLRNQLRIASSQLQNERNSFEGISDSHIEREATTQLLEWLRAEPEFKHNRFLNICFLAAQAGYGKTVVLKDLYEKCIEQDVPVLALKADKLYANNLNALKENLGIEIPLYDFIKECKKKFDRVVILIDQIDALCQSMAADRSYLELYRNLIEYFSKDKQVRFVVSSRTVDLQYDPTLRFYKDVKTIRLNALSVEELNGLLVRIGIGKDELSPKLLEILKVPNHLNVFSLIASDKSVRQATNVLELYLELWRQKVIMTRAGSKVKSKDLKQVLYLIARTMFERQRITVPLLKFEDHDAEIKYLESERLLKVEERQIQFFHQSFYDFVFAKQFAEDGQELLNYIISQGQSISIRSAVKMIISYLREFDPAQYGYTLKQVFTHPDIMFHIKHILFTSITAQENPDRMEMQFILDSMQRSFHWRIVFFEHAFSAAWLRFADQKELFNILDESYIVNSDDTSDIEPVHLQGARNAATGFLSRFVVKDNDPAAWDLLARIKRSELTWTILFGVTDWSNPLAYVLFEGCSGFEETDPFQYYHVLDNIAKKNFSYALDRVAELLPGHFKRGLSQRDYEEHEVLKTLAKQRPDRLFPVLFNSMSPDFEREGEIEDRLFRDFKYSFVIFTDSEDVQGKEFLYLLLAVCLRKSAKNYHKAFLEFFNAHKHSNYQAILRVLLHALKGTERTYPAQVFEMFEIFKEKGLLYYSDDVEHDLRVILGNAFPFFSPEQQVRTINTIRHYTDAKEIYYHASTDKEKRFLSSDWGLSKYFMMLRLPSEVVQAEFKDDFEELKRKFRDRVDAPKRRTVLAGVVQSPIAQKAAKKMNTEQWLRSFKKYSDDRSRNGKDFLKGGLSQLAGTFQSFVSEQPNENKLQLISRALDDGKVPLKYPVYGLWGWIDGKGDPDKIVPLLRKIFLRNLGSEKQMIVSVASRVLGGENEDEEVVRFMIDAALNFPVSESTELVEETEKHSSINGLISVAINSIHGQAIYGLAHVNDVRFENMIFETVEKVLMEGPAESRAGLFFRFAQLMHLNLERAVNLFLYGLQKEKNMYVIAASIWSFQYFKSHRFEQFVPVYERLIDSGLIGDEDGRHLFLCLYGAYLHGEPGSKEILFKFLEVDCQVRSRALSNVIECYYTVPDTESKSDAVLHFILDRATADDVEELNWSFLHADHVKLLHLFPFLERFICSAFFKFSNHFLDYLTSQMGQDPLKAVVLFDMAVKRKIKPDERFSYRIEEKSLNFIVNALNGLIGTDEETKAAKQRLLVAFDLLMKDQRSRVQSEKILDQLL